jgi:Ca-activated chloride channel family protein
VTYAGSSGVALESTPGTQKDKIRSAIKDLGAGGSTAGADGIRDAYKIAEENFIEGGNNRVILGTDGDFNVGISSQEKLIQLIENKRSSGVFLTVCGLGTGNLQEGKMEQLANHGNGTFEYIDKLSEGRKVFIHDRNDFYTVAKDVKVQVNFDSTQIKAYRLIGYENRVLNEEDFDNDSIDAAEIGANQSITALYQVVPHENQNAGGGTSAFTIDFRYKDPQDEISLKLSLDVEDQNPSFMNASEHTRFAASVAGYGMLLIDSEHKGSLTYEKVSNWAMNAKTFDPHGYRASFTELIDLASSH